MELNAIHKESMNGRRSHRNSCRTIKFFYDYANRRNDYYFVESIITMKLDSKNSSKYNFTLKLQ